MRPDRSRLLRYAAAVAATALALAVSLAFHDWYRAQATMLPPETADLLRNIIKGHKVLMKLPTYGILGEYATEADLFQRILTSRTVQDSIIRRFDLGRIYHQPDLARTERELTRHYQVWLNPEGSISVLAEDYVRPGVLSEARALELARLLLRENVQRIFGV